MRGVPTILWSTIAAYYCSLLLQILLRPVLKAFLMICEISCSGCYSTFFSVRVQVVRYFELTYNHEPGNYNPGKNSWIIKVCASPWFARRNEKMRHPYN